MPATSGYGGYGYGPGQVGYWPYYGLGSGMGVADVDGIKLTLAKQEVQDLPPVDIDHQDRRAGRT